VQEESRSLVTLGAYDFFDFAREAILQTKELSASKRRKIQKITGFRDDKAFFLTFAGLRHSAPKSQGEPSRAALSPLSSSDCCF
jgi:hypothetical protein